jgi:hypothetical protein
MKLSKYPLASDDEFTAFEFVSEGRNGLVHKLVQFTPTNLKGLYNLAFGDKNISTGGINDLVVTNNGDSEKVLATVASAVYAFTDKYPDAWVYATGSTRSRTRLYQIGISKYLKEVEQDFEILAELKDDWETYRENRNYEGFMIRRRVKK